MPTARFNENAKPGIFIIIYDKQRATIIKIAPMPKRIKLNIRPKQPYFLLMPIPDQKTRAIIANATLNGAANMMHKAIITNKVINIVLLSQFCDMWGDQAPHT